jgi:4-oxalocrotonate tautomerase
MPHIIVKLWPGRNDEIKIKLAKNIASSVAEELNVDIGDVSVAIEEIPREEWGEYISQR